MRHSLYVGVALAALIAAAGTASAANNTWSAWATSQEALKNTSKVQATAKPVTPTTSKAFTSAKGFSSATTTPTATASNSSAQATFKAPTSATKSVTVSAPLGLTTKKNTAPPEKPPTPTELKTDLADAQDYLKRLQRTDATIADDIKRNLATHSYHWDPKNPNQMKCDSSGNCVGFLTVELADLTAVEPGKGILKVTKQVFEIPVDKTGAPLPGAQQALEKAQKTFYDNGIAFTEARIAADKKQLADDFNALNPWSRSTGSTAGGGIIGGLQPDGSRPARHER